MSEENVALQHRVIATAIDATSMPTWRSSTRRSSSPPTRFRSKAATPTAAAPACGNGGRTPSRSSLEVRAEVYEVRDLGSITLVRGCLRGRGGRESGGL